MTIPKAMYLIQLTTSEKVVSMHGIFDSPDVAETALKEQAHGGPLKFNYSSSLGADTSYVNSAGTWNILRVMANWWLT